MAEVRKNRVMYVGNFSFTKNNRESYGYNFVEFAKRDDGSKFGISKTVFTNEPLDVSGLTPGDFVNCVMQESEFLDGKAKLVKILVVSKSVVFG